MQEIPLGKPVDYPQEYAPGVLFPIARSESRGALFSAQDLPFRGEDVWNAWELSWLDTSGKPVVATACIRIPADSANLIESKSLKLYLNSHAYTRYTSAGELQEIVTADLSGAVESAVSVEIAEASVTTSDVITQFPGVCIDDLHIESPPAESDAGKMRSDAKSVVREELYSHLLRSNCPVTNQPDVGSILIRYEGAQINRQRLLEYIISYRHHSGFHEACVERIFMDIRNKCEPIRLTVYARYNRRGGLDINPFRSDYEETPQNLRLWRQ